MDSERKIYQLNGDFYMTKVSVVVYGADVVCASCVNAPTSKIRMNGYNHY